jgi:DNA-binding NtrC family response regulator
MHKFQTMLRNAREARHAIEPVLAGSSVTAHALRQMAQLAASVDNPILLTGADNAGKAGMARAIHSLSGRAGQPVKLLVPDLQANDFVVPDTGVVFIDEIGCLRPEQQDQLAGMCERDSGAIRLIAGARNPLGRGEIAPRLFNLCNQLVIPVPTLEQRRDDITEMLKTFWAGQTTLPHPLLTTCARSRVTAHAWPGNLAQLERFATRAMAVYSGRRVDARQAENLLR